MGDRFIVTRETGATVTLILSFIIGITVGLILFLGSFVVLWRNESQVNMAKVAETSVHVSAETVEPAADGKFVSVTGELKSEESVGDPQFLRAGSYIALNRKVEMYSWVEGESQETRTENRGGRETTITKHFYIYKKEWSATPPNSNSFKNPEGHENPPPSIENQSFTVQQATLGVYRFDPRSVKLPDPSPIPIPSDSFIPSNNAHLEGDHIYIGNGTLQTPEIGDLRISYSSVEPDTMITLFGKLDGDSVGPYFYNGEKRLYRAIKGSREDAIALISFERLFTGWRDRGIAFLMMWIGLSLSIGPINTVFNFRFVGCLVINLGLFLVAFVLWLIAIYAFAIAHNAFVLLGGIAVVGAAIWALSRIVPRQKLAKAYTRTDGAAPRAQAQLQKKEPSVEEEAIWRSIETTGTASGKIQFKCEKCGKRYTVKASLAGRKARCKECGHTIYIPTESAN